jgi:hypothetical protein
MIVCLSVNFYTPEPLGLGTNHPLGEFKFVRMKGLSLLQGEIIAKE